MERFEVYEDNGGFYHLFVFDKYDEITYQHSYDNKDQFDEDMEEIEYSDPASDWDGNEMEESPDLYNYIINHPNGYNEITEDY